MTRDEVLAEIDAHVGRLVVGFVLDPRDIEARPVASITGILERASRGYEIRLSGGVQTGVIFIDSDAVSSGERRAESVPGGSPGPGLVVMIAGGLTLVLTNIEH